MKKDIYQDITNSIIEALERVNSDDFKAPFAQLAGQALPLNPMTGNAYRGINTVVLWFAQFKAGYSSGEWGTYKQWQEKGAQVKKNEKSTTIIYYQLVEKKDVNKKEKEQDFYNMLKYYSVFNADQVENYQPEIKEETRILGNVETIKEIDTFVEKTKAVIIENQSTPCFIPSLDQIHMVSKEIFFEDEKHSATDNYYAILFHELTHWSGGKTRLNRKQSALHNDFKAYAFEELIAELGSAFLCAQFKIKQEGREDHAQYIKTWLQALKSDKKYIFQAAAQAQKANDFLNKTHHT